jgi:outer membrane protein OmpA-like peptidoglycan-associated protein
MRLLLATILCSFCSVATVVAQYSDADIEKILAKSSDDELVALSMDMINEGYYTPAEKLVDKLLASQPENANYNFRKGAILANAYAKFGESLPYLRKAVKDVKKNHDSYSASEKAAPPEAYYQLGRSLHRTGDLAGARANYESYLAVSNKKSSFYAPAQNGIDQIAFAEKLMENPKRNVNIVNLGTVINTSDPEYSPVVSFDGSSLYFTSRRKWEKDQSEDSRDPQYGLYPEDIYVSYKDFDESWTDPVRLEFCDPDQNEASISVSMDEKRIYVYQDTKGNGDIFYSDFTTNRFRDIKAVDNKDINSDHWDTHISVTPDGRTIYFASERPEGMGGRDIYRIVKLPDGSWSKPQNLGSRINSPFDEDAPFIASDNKSLYFASNGPKSIGGFDILVSVIDGDNQWSEPINLGVPVNSTYDDVFYTETVDGRRGYITSMRGDSHGEKDIYEVQNDYLTVSRGAILKGKVFVKDDKPLPDDLTVTVTCLDCDPRYDRTVYPRMRDGMFMMSLDPCRSYEMSFSHNDGKNEFYRESFTTDCMKEKDEIYREVLLDRDNWTIVPPEVVAVVGEDLGEIIRLNPIFFDFDKYDIRPDAAAELDKIVKAMQDHPGLTIALGSHTDTRGVAIYNQWLSDERAKASKAYIVSRGISADRLTAQGYGEEKPINSDQKIKGLKTKKDRDIAHARNRRTEFIIVKEK